MLTRRFYRFLFVVVPLGFFIYASTRPLNHLKAVVPPGFVDTQTQTGPAQRAAEEQVAQAYWNCALTYVQWQYSYGAALPVAPSDEFRLNGNTAPVAEPDASRLRYWNRLRQAWLEPSSWVSSREWSTDWFTAPLLRSWGSFKDFLDDTFARV